MSLENERTTVKRKTKPRIEINLDVVEGLAAQGLSDTQIAQVLGISRSTLVKRKRESAQFTQAINRGKAKGIAKVTQKLFEKINQNDLGAIIFYLHCQGGWSEKQKVELTCRDGAPVQVQTITESNDKQKAMLDKVLDENF